MELSADNHRAIYIPERFAHGNQALEDNTEMTYHAGEFYTPGSEGGLPYDDPRLASELATPGHHDVEQGSRVGSAGADRGRIEDTHARQYLGHGHSSA